MNKHPTPVPSDRYHCFYTLEVNEEGLTNAEAQARTAGKDEGACHSVFIASLLYPSNGALSVLFMSKCGTSGEELDDNEWHKVWLLLTQRLARSETLQEGKRKFCEAAFNEYCELLGRPRGGAS